jgi:formimidoylglutamate deiminase
MLPAETLALAQSGAVAGLCPITESNLGDGIFDGARYQSQQGNWGVGSDSNIRISLSEELRTLEYSQRLRDHRRAIYATEEHSTGRRLYQQAVAGGARALQRNSGAIAPGRQADLLALDKDATALMPVKHDAWLDAWLFAADDSLVTDVWVSGEHVVSQGRHQSREVLESRYRQVMKTLTSRL